MHSCACILSLTTHKSLCIVASTPGRTPQPAQRPEAGSTLYRYLAAPVLILGDTPMQLVISASIGIAAGLVLLTLVAVLGTWTVAG